MSRTVALQIGRAIGGFMVWLAALLMCFSGFAALLGDASARDISEGALFIGANGLLIERWLK